MHRVITVLPSGVAVFSSENPQKSTLFAARHIEERIGYKPRISITQTTFHTETTAVALIRLSSTQAVIAAIFTWDVSMRGKYLSVVFGPHWKDAHVSSTDKLDQVFDSAKRNGVTKFMTARLYNNVWSIHSQGRSLSPLAVYVSCF